MTDQELIKKIVSDIKVLAQEATSRDIGITCMAGPGYADAKAGDYWISVSSDGSVTYEYPCPKPHDYVKPEQIVALNQPPLPMDKKNAPSPTKVHGAKDPVNR